MLQSVGSQRVGHGLATEQRHPQGRKYTEERSSSDKTHRIPNFRNWGKKEDKRTRWFLDSKTGRIPRELHFSLPLEMGYREEKQRLEDAWDSCRLCRTNPRGHPASSSSPRWLRLAGVCVHVPRTREDLTSQT